MYAIAEPSNYRLRSAYMQADLSIGQTHFF